jgi:hypothetical protein
LLTNVYAVNNETKISYDKTKFMIFHKAKGSTVAKVRESVYLGRTLKRVFEFRYIGLLLYTKLNFNKHCFYVISKVFSRIKYIKVVKRHPIVHVMCS